MRMMLLGGWGMPAAVLEPLRLALGIAPEHSFTLNRPLQDLRSRIVAELLPGSLLIGWSLGGSLALDIAAQAQDRLTGVVTIATNPRFVQASDWPNAYDPSLFQKFAQQLSVDPQVTLERFASLITLGSDFQREELRWLRDRLEPELLFRPEVLSASLDVLREMDLRQALTNLRIPTVHILGQKDALVPSTVAGDIRQLSSNSEVHVISGMAHLPSFRFASQVAEQVRESVLPIIRRWC